MSFRPRPPRTTMRRPATTQTVLRRSLEAAVHDPHGAGERVDPEFLLSMVCRTCGRMGQARRRDVHAAIREHVERHHGGTDTGVAVQVLYPKQQ